jgi:hypothetical protein
MPSKMFNLSDRTCLVTGSARGLGNALASAASDYVSGQLIFVDGGLMAVL